MKTKYTFSALLLFSGLILFSSCGVSNNNFGPKGINSNNSMVDLTDYLRSIAGVQVSGSGATAQISIRGAKSSSFMSSTDPLFVIDGQTIDSYSSAFSAVLIDNIKSVEVLKDASTTASYGVRGANGVIVIKTK